MSSQADPRETPTIGAVVVDPGGERVGAVVAVGLDAGTAQSNWLLVERDQGGRTALPAFIVSLTSDGQLIVPFSESFVGDAPLITADVLSEETVDAVLTYYGLA